MDNCVLQFIKDLLALLHCSHFCLELIVPVKHLLRLLEVPPGDLSHPGNFFTGEFQSHLGIAQNVFIKVLDAFFQIFIFSRDQFCGDLGQHLGEWQPEKGVKNIKKSMGVGDLALDHTDLSNPQSRLRARGDLINKSDKEGEYEKADNSSEDIKEAMGECRAFGSPVGTDAGEDPGNSSADIIA